MGMYPFQQTPRNAVIQMKVARHVKFIVTQKMQDYQKVLFQLLELLFQNARILAEARSANAGAEQAQQNLDGAAQKASLLLNDLFCCVKLLWIL